MLVMPLFCIVSSSLKQGLGFYFKSVSSKYVVSALKVTLFATVIAVVINTFFGLCAAWVTTKFSFKGKQVLATLIDIPFNITRYRWTCVSYDIRASRLVLSCYKMV